MWVWVTDRERGCLSGTRGGGWPFRVSCRYPDLLWLTVMADKVLVEKGVWGELQAKIRPEISTLPHHTLRVKQRAWDWVVDGKNYWRCNGRTRLARMYWKSVHPFAGVSSSDRVPGSLLTRGWRQLSWEAALRWRRTNQLIILAAAFPGQHCCSIMCGKQIISLVSVSRLGLSCQRTLGCPLSFLALSFSKRTKVFCPCELSLLQLSFPWHSDIIHVHPTPN